MLEASENIPKVTASPSVEAGNHVRFETISTQSEREAFIEQALLDYESPLIGYASTILNDLYLARDVVQDTFIRLCRQDPDKVRDSLKSWLFTVCRNRALDILRKENRSQSLDDHEWKNVASPELQPDEQTDQQERLTQLTGYLSRLSTNQREVIVLKFQQGLSYQEIHLITGLTTSNIGVLIHTGLKRLREILPADLRS
jgi:RNA polymerase sigma factor (sigma-70 family)